jgi:hypothetical protein
MVPNLLKIAVLVIISLQLNSCVKNTDESFDSLDENSKDMILDIYNRCKKERQSADKRKYSSAPILIKEIYFGDSIYNPGLMETIDSSIYILDLSNMMISLIDYSTSCRISSFGNGKGRGPGEMIRPTDMKITDNVYISDVSKGTIEVYSQNGKYIKSIKLNSCSPYKFILNENQEFIINNELDKVFPFYKYDKEGKFLKKFGTNLILRQIKTGLYHDLKLCSISGTSFLQLPIRLGVIGLYKNDDLMLIKETIDGKQTKPIGLIYGENSIHTDRNNYVFTALLEACNNDYIVLYSKSKYGDEKKSSFDIYRASDLDYLISFTIDTRVYGISLIGNKFIILGHESISIWDLNTVIKESI